MYSDNYSGYRKYSERFMKRQKNDTEKMINSDTISKEYKDALIERKNRYYNTKEYVDDDLERYSLVYFNGKKIDEFLRDISELYSEYDYLNINKDIVYSTLKDKFVELKSNNIDLSVGINKPYYDNGDTELMYTFRWARDLNVIIDWFMLLLEFGGNPYLKNHNNENSFDIALSVFKKEGIEDQFPIFIKDVNKVISLRN